MTGARVDEPLKLTCVFSSAPEAKFKDKSSIEAANISDFFIKTSKI
jgi:hypothetical protein